MRICYLADGRYIHAHRWLRFFSKRGHQMSLLSFAPMEPHHVQAIENAARVTSARWSRFISSGFGGPHLKFSHLKKTFSR
jgi:hypothetical protein